MAAFSAELSGLQKLYETYGEDLFALCYLHTGRTGPAFALMRTVLADLRYSRKQWEPAQTGAAGFFRAAHASCMDFHLKNPKGKKPRTFWTWQKSEKREPQPQEAAGAALPFSLTDPLRRVLRLPAQYKTPLFLCVRKGWSAEEAAEALKTSPARVSRLLEAGLKKAELDAEKAKACLAPVAAGDDVLLRVWDKFLVDQDDKGFAGTQRLRRFKRWLDNAIPYIALGAVLFGMFAYLGVDRGWFTGTPYSRTAPVEGVAVSGYYGNAPESTDAEAETGTVSVFVPEGEERYIEYLAAHCPLTVSAATRQMVALGGAPEGTSLLFSSSVGPGGGAVSLELELSEEAAAYFADSGDRRMLRAMTATYNSLYGGKLEKISIQSGGKELAAGEATAQSLLFEEGLAVDRTVDTEYRG